MCAGKGRCVVDNDLPFGFVMPYNTVTKTHRRYLFLLLARIAVNNGVNYKIQCGPANTKIVGLYRCCHLTNQYSRMLLQSLQIATMRVGLGGYCGQPCYCQIRGVVLYGNGMKSEGSDSCASVTSGISSC